MMNHSRHRNVVVLTGAGISKESGIQTFRGQNGLWEGVKLEEVATPEAFEANPERVLEFYNQRRRQLQSEGINPNPAHTALAEFEQRFRGEFLLVTQNIDHLHEEAGSKNILHMHGSLLQARCLKTGVVYDWKEDITLETTHTCCPKQKGLLRPHVVWFGEMPLFLEKIEKALSQCDLFVAIGTSGVVYPAAGFVEYTPSYCKRVEINIEETPVAELFKDKIIGPASQTVPEFFSKL